VQSAARYFQERCRGTEEVTTRYKYWYKYGPNLTATFVVIDDLTMSTSVIKESIPKPVRSVEQTIHAIGLVMDGGVLPGSSS
jgi:hypothetical protein